MEDNKNTFEYTYSALTEQEKKKVAFIKRRYETVDKSSQGAFEKMKALDKKVHNTATLWSLVFGVVGCLIFGLGLSMVLEWDILDYGIIIMAVGIIPIAVAYPLYNYLIKRGKKKYGAQIIELAEELLK